MNKQLSATTVGIVFALIVVIIVGMAVWMWRAPAGGSYTPPPNTPESAAETRERGRQKTEEFIATHRRSARTGVIPNQAEGPYR